MCSTHNTTHGIDIFSSFILVCGADLKHIVNLTCYRGGGIKRTVLALNLFYTIPKLPENIYAVGGVVGRAHPPLV